ncbi:MAG: hypothetical protein NVS3B1_17600 [Marmoricola sp.]
MRWTVYEAQYKGGKWFGPAADRLPDKVIAEGVSVYQADALIASRHNRWASPAQKEV